MAPSMDALLSRFRNEAEVFISRMEEAELGVGNGVPVNFDEPFAHEHGINRAGRLTRTAGVREFHAAPTFFDRRESMKAKVDDYTDDVRRFANKGTFDFSRKRVPPVSYSLTFTTGVPHRYEPQVLRDLHSKYGYVTLVNPALATLWRCQYLLNFGIYLTESTPAYMAEMYDIAAFWRPRRDLEFIDEIKGVAYLGTNGPRRAHRFQEVDWVCLTPNPYQVSFPHDEFSLRREESCVKMSYYRKERWVHIDFHDEPDHFRYNPVQVDSAYRSTGVDDATRYGSKFRYYLETNSHSLVLPRLEDAIGEPLGRLPHFPPFVNGVSCDAKYLYDMDGYDSTYMSRRHALRPKALEMGLDLVPITIAGFNVVTTNSLSPFLGPFASEFSDGDSHYVSCAGEFDVTHKQLDVITGYGCVYSTSISIGVRATPFFEGAYTKVGFNHLLKKFYFNPAVPGLYFFFPSVASMHAFQLPVLYRLYGARFKPSICPYVPLDYETADVSSYVHGVLDSLPYVDSVGTGGLEMRELARLSGVSYLYLKYVIPMYTGVVTYAHEKGTMVTSVRRIREAFTSPTGIVEFGALWLEWASGRPLSFFLYPEVERFREIANLLGRPVIKDVIVDGKILLYGMPIRNYTSRKPLMAPFVPDEYESF